MNPLDFPQIATEWGGTGVAFAALSMVVRSLWMRLMEQIEGRLADHKDHAQQMSENTRTLERALDVMEGRSRG